ncbi:hypothetical protein J2W17_001456 [Pseudomonas lini]|nr:hypothetical protein [Pseudomonas lini]
MNSQSIIVPKISTLPVHEPRARAVVRWLVRKNIIKEELTTCGRTGNRMAHAIADGARAVVLHPQALPFGEPVNGLEIITKRCIYTPAKGFLEEAGCAECRKEVGEALFESLEDWMQGAPITSPAPSAGMKTTSTASCSCRNAAFPTWGSFSTIGPRPGSRRALSTSLPIGSTSPSVGLRSSCRSKLAREEPQGCAFNQVGRVIVNDLRWQASSYRITAKPGAGLSNRRTAAKLSKSPVDHRIDISQSFTLNPRGCLTIMARFHFPAREPPRCCVSAKKL